MEPTAQKTQTANTRIPSPPGTKFREFRIGVAPWLVFGMTLVVVSFSWRSYVGPAQIVGEVESSRSVVSSTVGGRISRLLVSPLEKVTAGQPIAQIVPEDPKVFDAEVALIKAKIDVAHLGVIPLLRKQNNFISFQQVRLNLMKERVSLASARAKLAYSDLELTRLKQVMGIGTNTPANNLGNNDTNSLVGISLAQLDKAQRNVDAFREEVRELESLISSTEEWIKNMAPGEEEVGEEAPASIKAAIAVEEKNLEVLEAKMAPITLNAPIDGVVSTIYLHAGEAVSADQPIATISATATSRIYAYVRQPIGYEPVIGAPIEIRTRSSDRHIAKGSIVRASPHLEAVPVELLPHAPSSSHVASEFGLPFLVSIPPGLSLHPGEIVDLRPVKQTQ